MRKTKLSFDYEKFAKLFHTAMDLSGLLGLFLGFSFMSGIEMLYWCCCFIQSCKLKPPPKKVISEPNPVAYAQTNQT